MLAGGGRDATTTEQGFTCRFCRAVLQAWLRVAGEAQVDLVRILAGPGLVLQQAFVPVDEREVCTAADE